MVIPTKVNHCICECGTEIGKGSTFAPGHDRKAAARIISEHYGNHEGFILAHTDQPWHTNNAEVLGTVQFMLEMGFVQRNDVDSIIRVFEKPHNYDREHRAFAYAWQNGYREGDWRFVDDEEYQQILSED